MAYVSGATYTQLLTDGYTKNQLCVPNCSGVPLLIVLSCSELNVTIESYFHLEFTCIECLINGPSNGTESDLLCRHNCK